MSPNKRKRYRVVLHHSRRIEERNATQIYAGASETIMYSHVSAVEWALTASYGTADIEIVEDGESRWIDYRDGARTDFPDAIEVTE